MASPSTNRCSGACGQSMHRFSLGGSRSTESGCSPLAALRFALQRVEMRRAAHTSNITFRAQHFGVRAASSRRFGRVVEFLLAAADACAARRARHIPPPSQSGGSFATPLQSFAKYPSSRFSCAALWSARGVEPPLWEGGGIVMTLAAADACDARRDAALAQ